MKVGNPVGDREHFPPAKTKRSRIREAEIGKFEIRLW